VVEDAEGEFVRAREVASAPAGEGPEAGDTADAIERLTRVYEDLKRQHGAP
jgi:hypothetical protein